VAVLTFISMESLLSPSGTIPLFGTKIFSEQSHKVVGIGSKNVIFGSQVVIVTSVTFSFFLLIPGSVYPGYV
jgi:hypothetical protein